MPRSPPAPDGPAPRIAPVLLGAAAAGLLGLLALAGHFALRRRWRDRAALTALPAGTAEALGTALAAVAAVACFGTAFDTEMTRRGIGAGEPWSLGVAAAAAAAVFRGPRQYAAPDPPGISPARPAVFAAV